MMWFDKYSERWANEKAALSEFKIDFKSNEEVINGDLLSLTLSITQESKITIPPEFIPLELKVVFPSQYPYFRPEIYAEGINLPRHQHIVDKNLCLLPRASENWFPETLLANFLKEQLPKVFSEGLITDPEVLKRKDDEQAEPVSEYYPSFPNASIIFDTIEFDKIPPSDAEIELLGFVNIGIATGSSLPCRMAVLSCFNNQQQSLNILPKVIEELYMNRGQVTIYRLKERPPHADAQKDYKWINNLFQTNNIKHKKLSNRVALKNGDFIDDIIGLTFPEEHKPGEISWGWLFLVHFIHTQPNKRLPPQKGIYYSKINRFNAEELIFRNPSLKNLKNSKIAVFGLGALGAPSVIEFAKNGVGEVRLIDFDTVNAGTIARWPLGIPAAGKFKTDALEEFCNFNYPFTNIKKYLWRVGSPEKSQTSFDDILQDVTLIYDATAENGVSHYLSQEAKERNIPYISIYGTPGVWGGAVVRQMPHKTKGCWMCLQYSFEDGLIQKPPVNQRGSIQAAGCGDLTFTGTSFELGEIVNSGVRLAVMTLCTNSDFKDIVTDIGILSLVDDHGNPILPKWESFELNVHRKCPYCNTL